MKKKDDAPYRLRVHETGIFNLTKFRYTIAIVAMGPTMYLYFKHCGINNYASRITDEVWVVNDNGFRMHDIDRIIALDDLPNDRRTWPHWVEQMEARGIPIWTSNAKGVKNGVAYPLKAVERSIPLIAGKRPWAEQTCPYALALAIHELKRFKKAPTAVLLYGIDNLPIETGWCDPAVNVRYDYWKPIHQRVRKPSEPCDVFMAYLTGIAQERGIEVYVPDGSTLFDFDRPIYYEGYLDQPAWLDTKTFTETIPVRDPDLLAQLTKGHGCKVRP